MLEKFDGLNIAVIDAQGLDNSGESEAVNALLREKEKELRENFETKTLSERPKIKAWRQAYSSFGAKPKKNKCSVENLYRSVLQGNELRHINKLVDIYNFISLKHMLPIGGDDFDKVEGNISLRLAKGDERFTELNSEEATRPHEGEVVYADDKEVLCRRWNWRECDKSKMTEETKHAVLVVEGLPPVSSQEVKAAAQELKELIEKHCGGQASVEILNREKPELTL